MADPPKILKPNQVEIPMDSKVIPLGGNLQIALKTPEGRTLVVLIQVVDYNWETNQVLLNVGNLDLTEASKQGKFGIPKGIIH